MPDFAAAFRDFFTVTTLEVMLAAIGILTAGVGWVLAMKRRARKATVLRGVESAYEDWNGEDGLVFPSGGGGDFRRRPVDNRRFEYDDVRPADSMFVGGIEAVRERPLEFLAGALAAGFAAGLLLPIFSNRSSQTRLLEGLFEVSEESRTQAQREAKRFRQARPK
jgi:hypothetical protein